MREIRTPGSARGAPGNRRPYLNGQNMGLDASVYRDDEDEHQIVSVRIGNAAGVGYLSEVIEANVPGASVLLTKVLYSASHCGDRLSRSEVAKAKSELEEVRARLVGDEAVEEFVVEFGRVIDAALQHDRPVTF